MKKAAPLYKVLSAETKNAKENCLMYNSIIDFIENDTTKIKKILEKYLFIMAQLSRQKFDIFIMN